MILAFHVNGIPKAQPRVKAYRRGNFVGVFDPGSANEWKARVAIAARDYAPPQQLQGPLMLEMKFLMPRPKAHYRSNGELRDDPPSHHISKPDLDNLAKAVMDAISDLGTIWRDDSQVAEVRMSKVYTGCGGGCTIVIKPLL